MENMIAMTLFGLLAAGITSSLIFARRMAESGIYQNTAMTVAQGYLEQIKSMDFAQLALIAEESDTRALPTVSMSALHVNGEGDPQISNPLWLDQWNEREVMVDLRPGEENEEPVTLSVNFYPTIRDLSQDEDPRDALEITLRVRWYSLAGDRHTADDEWQEATLGFVRSHVPTF